MATFRTSVAIAAMAVAVSSLSPWPMGRADAALANGVIAPNFTAAGVQGGRRFSVSLARELRRGPVVIYFFPRAFTTGCTIESRAFAEAMPQFRRAGATPQIIADFDVSLRPGITNRTSYVIARDGPVALFHNDMNPNDHVRETLAAVQRLQAARRR